MRGESILGWSTQVTSYQPKEKSWAEVSTYVSYNFVSLQAHKNLGQNLILSNPLKTVDIPNIRVYFNFYFIHS